MKNDRVQCSVRRFTGLLFDVQRNEKIIGYILPCSTKLVKFKRIFFSFFPPSEEEKS